MYIIYIEIKWSIILYNKQCRRNKPRYSVDIFEHALLNKLSYRFVVSLCSANVLTKDCGQEARKIGFVSLDVL